MTSEDLLQSKYDRLCVEFKKLRNKHHDLKELTYKELSELQQLREKQRDRELHIINLQRECECLRFRNAQLDKQLRQLTAGTDASRVSPAGHTLDGTTIDAAFEAESDILTVALDRKITHPSDHPIGNLNSDGSSPRRTNSASAHSASKSHTVTVETDQHINVFSTNGDYHHPEDSAACSDRPVPNDPGIILKELIVALRDWTNAALSPEKRVDFSAVHGALVDRVAQLERQVCELSLQCQLEKKRRLMNQEQTDSRPSQLIRADCDDNKTTAFMLPPRSLPESLVIDGLQQRIRTLTDQAQYFAGLATFLQEEIRCLAPRVIGLAREAYFHQSESVKSRELIQKISNELDQANSATLRQSNEMAQHIANLTDELQELRVGLGRNNSLDTASNPSKKVSIFSVLKR
ncbi:hypothetical protein CRM22_000530 [Opisthorchis felineus]|uniref:Protein phosphatase 1 regulatory subunit 21 N-terminal domain-containing protein n=1 Tax=Opisthorchis felineus TaxID=147828 RepID=A0A4S2MEM6_OPIFE|nr:hypothetical protein CRM22_000530 [Opisthorchis felineus]TGZ75180.1 hypothetical protein CRM22_000530 [Opisthorchis felineus]